MRKPHKYEDDDFIEQMEEYSRYEPWGPQQYILLWLGFILVIALINP
jgi:hypothetical protein